MPSTGLKNKENIGKGLRLRVLIPAIEELPKSIYLLRFMTANTL